MSPIPTVIETFEGEAKRILWLPSITLGYIFTISGATVDFWMAVGAIGGARLFHDLITSGVATERDGEMDSLSIVLDWLESQPSRLKLYLYLPFMVVYLSAGMIQGPLRLYQYFNHGDPVLVGLAGVYWGILIVVVMNL